MLGLKVRKLSGTHNDFSSAQGMVTYRTAEHH